MKTEQYNKIIGKGIKTHAEYQKLDVFQLAKKIHSVTVEGIFAPVLMKIMLGRQAPNESQFEGICKTLNVSKLEIFLAGLSGLKRRDRTKNEQELVGMAIELAGKLAGNAKERVKFERFAIDTTGDRFTKEEKEQFEIVRELALAIANTNVINKLVKA